MEMIKLEQLVVAEANRKVFDKQKFEELKQSIAEKGIITPLLARPYCKGDDVALRDPSKWEIVNGARRFKAAQELKLKGVPCIVRDMTDAEAAELRLVENLQREDLGPLEEAQEYERLIKQFGNTLEKVADKVSKPRGYIKARLALLELQEDVLKAYQDKKVQIGHLLVISRVSDKKKQKQLLAGTIKYSLRPADTERNLWAVLRDYDLDYAVFDKKGCSGCEYRNGRQKSIFGGDADDSTCLKPECFNGKTEERLQKEKSKLAKSGRTVLTKTEAKAQKYSAIPTGYNGFSEAQQKKCGKCANAALAIHVSYNNINTELVCKDRECMGKLKEAARKQSGTSQQDPKGRAIEGLVEGMVGCATDELVAARMNDTVALFIAIEYLSDDEVKPSKKPTTKELITALAKAAVIFTNNGNGNRDRILRSLEITKKNIVFTAAEIAKFPPLKDSKDCTAEEVIAALEKQGYKVTEEKKTETRKK